MAYFSNYKWFIFAQEAPVSRQLAKNWYITSKGIPRHMFSNSLYT